MKKNGFNWKEFLKAIAVIAIPVALQNLLTTTGSMVDTMMLARLGETTVGAVGLCAQFSSLFFSGYWGFIGGGTLFVSQYWGAKNDDGIRRSYGITLCLVLAVGVIFNILAVLFPQAVMGIYTDKAEIQQIGIAYLRIVGFAYPLQSITVVMSMLLRSTERVRIPLIAGIASVCSNCFFNYIFIFGKFGAPAIAAVAVYRTIEGVVIAFFGGFASAAAILVGKAVGAGEHEEAQSRTVRIVYLTSGIIFVVCCCLLIFHTPLFHALGLSGESFEICTVLCTIYCIVAVIRMGNWQHNDCFRAGGDPAFGTIMEITFMYLMVIPCVYTAHFVFHAPFYLVFALVYCDEPIRYVIMQRHLYSRKWIQPVSDKGLETIEAFREKYHVKMGEPIWRKKRSN